MIKFHRPDFVIAPPDTPPAKRNLLQKIFHKRKDDLSPAERRAVQIYADRSSRTKLFGGLITTRHKEPDMQSLTAFTVGRLRELADRMRKLDAKQKENDQANEAERIADIQHIESDGEEATGPSDAASIAQSLWDQLNALEEKDECYEPEEEIQETEQSDEKRSVADTRQSSERKRVKIDTPVEMLAQTARRYMPEAATYFEKTDALTDASLFTRTEQEASTRKAILAEEQRNDMYGRGWLETLNEQNRERADIANEIVDMFSAAAKKGIDLSKALSSDEIIYLTRAIGQAKAPQSLRVGCDSKVERDANNRAIRLGTCNGSFGPLKNIARQTAGLLHASQVQDLLRRMDDSASALDESARDVGAQPPISAGSLLENVEKILSTLTHIDPAELSRVCNQPGEQGTLAKSRILESLDNLQASTSGLRAGTLKALDLQESGSLPAKDKRQLRQAASLLEHIQKRVEFLQNKIPLTEEDKAAHPVTPNRNFSHLPQMRNHPFGNLRISTGGGASSKITLAEYLNIPLSPRTPDSGNDASHSSEMEAARLPRGLGWPLRMLIEKDRNFGTEQIATTSRKGKEICIAPEETGNKPDRPASSSAQASSSRPVLHREYNIAPPPTIPARLENGFAASSEPITPTGARPLHQQELSVIREWTRRVAKSLFGSISQEFMSEVAALVKDMELDGQLRGACIGLMRDGLTDCTDRPLVMWQQIRTKKYIRDAELGKYTTGDVYDLGIRTYRLAQVDEHALQLIKNISDDNKRLKRFAERESIEVILHARESLRDLLNLPIPKTDSISGVQAGIIPGMYSKELVVYGKDMLGAELGDGSHQVAHFLASWPPLTQQLRRVSPELEAIHQAIDTHKNAILEAIEEHNADDPKWSGGAPLTSASYEERLKQCGKEAEDMHFAADLAAVKTFMYGHHKIDATQKPPLEVELEKISAVQTQPMAQRFIPALKEALASGRINPSWVHPINRWNLLHVAAASGDPELVKALKERGVDMHQADNKGMLPLHVAASTASAATIRALDDLENINTQDKTGNSPLHWVASSGSVDALGALFQKSNARGSQEAPGKSPSSGVDVNIKNPISGATPLHIAVKTGKSVMARTLIGAGADPRIKDRNNKTAMDLLKHASAKIDLEEYKLTKKALEMGNKMMRLQEVNEPRS